MATIEAFEITQRRVGQMFEELLDYMSDDLAKGLQNHWRVLSSSVLGSVDMLHLVTFPLIYPGSHPLHLDSQFDEYVELGLINADLDAPAKDAHIWPEGQFDPDWAYSPAGTQDYPAWNGYPDLDPLLPDYPVSGSRIPVFMRGMFVTASSKSGSVPHTSTFGIVVPRAFDESSRGDLRDIRVYRFDSTTDNVPQLPIAEVARNVNAGTDTITVQVGNSVSQTIEEGVNTYYLVFWNSPDDTVAAVPTAASGTDATAGLNLTQRLPRDMFDGDRYDLVDFADTSGSHFIKARNHTQLELIDGSKEGYDTNDPEFYRLPALQGSLDPDFLTSDPAAGMGIGNIWGYGHSLDSGNSDPSSDLVAYGVTLSLVVSIERVQWVVRRGPDTPSEFWPCLWEDFAYHPPVEDNEIQVAKAVVKRIATSKEAAYRPNTVVVHLEYHPSYGRDHSRDLAVLDSLVPIMTRNLTLSDVVGEMADKMLFPLVVMTPSLDMFHGGVVGSMVSTLFSPSAPARFNAYWKNPLEDPEVKSAFGDLIEYMEEQLDNYPSQMDFHENICSMIAAYASFQPSRVLASFNLDGTDTSLGLGTACLSERKLAYPTALEIALPKKRTCHNLIQQDRIGRDYSVKLILRNQRLDKITKEMFLSASTKWISDRQASAMLAAGTPRDPYLWPSKLAQNPQWSQYGRAILVPDAMGGESHPLFMKPFDSRDTSLPVYEEFVADLESKGYTEEQILDAVTDQEYLHGGFDTVDYTTLPEQMVSIDELRLGVTMYNETGIPIWKASRDVFGEDPDVIRTRYGFKVGGSWYYQNFDRITCNDQRGSYVEAHEGLGEDAKHQMVDAGTPNTEFALNGTLYQLATSFSADFADVSPKITRVALKLKAVGLPAVNLQVTINAEGAGGSPGAVLQSSEWVPYSSLPLEFGWVEFEFLLPATLSSGDRYLICLFSDDSSPAVVLDSNNRVEWAYANLDAHSYGVTSTSSKLLEAVDAGDTSMSVLDASVYSSAPFYAMVDDEVVQVTAVTGNVLTLGAALTAVHSKDERVFEVTYSASDAEKRWVFKNSSGDAFAWAAPDSNQSYDATYRLDILVPTADPVEVVPPEEWSGTDLTATLDTLDTVYISHTSDAYDADASSEIYGTVGGLSPLATFNGPGTYGLPSLNSFRASGTNVIDGFVAWTTRRLAAPSTLSVFPSAILESSVVTYVPTEHDMYMTVGCVRWDGTIQVIDRLIPAGTSSPVLLDSGEFVGISFLWVQQTSFVSDDTYGYGAGEAFVVRSR